MSTCCLILLRVRLEDGDHPLPSLASAWSRYAKSVPLQFPPLFPCLPRKLENLEFNFLQQQGPRDPSAPLPYYIVSGVDEILCGVYVHQVGWLAARLLSGHKA